MNPTPMHAHLRNFWLCSLAALLTCGPAAWGESIPLSRPKPRPETAPAAETPAAEAAEEEEEEEEEAPLAPPPGLLRPKTVQRVGGEDTREPGRLDWGLSLLAHTPLIAENEFDSRFLSYGGAAVLTIPLFDIGLRAFVHLETGLLFTFSQAENTAGDVFPHTYFDFPVRLRFLYPLADRTTGRWTGEVYVGANLRMFEFNGDPSLPGGGLAITEGNLILPDVAIGMAYGLSPTLRARLLAGYLFLSLGVEFSFE